MGELVQRPVLVDAAEVDGALTDVIQRPLAVAQRGEGDLQVRKLQTGLAVLIHRPRDDLAAFGVG